MTEKLLTGTLSLNTNKQTNITLWASSQENLSSGFVTRVDSNWPTQLQRLAGVFEIFDLASIGIILSK